MAGNGDLNVGRVEYLNDPTAPKPNSLVPACGTLAVNGKGEILLQRRLDTGQWALPMGKQELGETPSQCAIRGRVARGISAPGSHRSRRNRLQLPGSCHSDHQTAGAEAVHFQCANIRGNR